jgi:1-acyl-sn-glycerol-3-phosphate acyltransferase
MFQFEFFMIYLFFFIGYISYNKNIISFLCRKILFYLGYTNNINNNLIENFPKKIIIIGSHTSIYDFFIGVMIYYGYLRNKYTSYILMKKEFEKICSPILSLIDNKFKLVKVDSQNTRITDKICNDLEKRDNYILFIAPEGTRKCTESLRKGYWYISQKLNIDVVYLGIDFYSKKIVLEEHRKIKNNWYEEKKEFIRSCVKYIPLYPERCFWTKDFYNKEM